MCAILCSAVYIEVCAYMCVCLHTFMCVAMWIYSLPSYIHPFLTLQSQAHHGFRRASDTLIMSKPVQPLVKYSPTLTPHRERSVQVIPDATMEGATIAKKIGKGKFDD